MFPFFFFPQNSLTFKKNWHKKLSKRTFGYFDKMHCTCTPANKTKQKTKQNKTKQKGKQKTKKSKLTKQTSTKLNK